MKGPPPLRGIRIVDLTMGWSGPLATRHLADMGAEVIKIESCGYPDWWRGWENTPEALANLEHEKSPAFNQVNRNKLGVTIDLTQAAGRALALKLVAGADGVIENQATGVMAKLGLSHDELREVNPSIIMLSLPAFGAEGPWSGYRGYGSTVEHGAGLPHLTGDADGPPIQTHIAYGDACGGLNAVAALLLALFHRKRTGQGQRIDISQVEGMLQLGVHGTIAQGLTGAPPPRTGNRHPTFVPHGCFACAAPDTWLVIAVTDDAMWPALCDVMCDVMGRADLGENPNLATAAGRRAAEGEIETAIAAWTGTREAHDAMRVLQDAGVAAGVVQRPTDLPRDPGYLARGFWQELDRDIVGRKPHPTTAYRFDGERGPLRTPAPLLGEHNQQVLGGILGLSEGELAALEAAGVIGNIPIAPTRPGKAKP
jgi:crotonobetainyl-CoA:carnitine CoA-transferase CaiB-like acyl-CoA transferase